MYFMCIYVVGLVIWYLVLGSSLAKYGKISQEQKLFFLDRYEV